MTVSRGLSWNAGMFAVRIFPACIVFGFPKPGIKLARRLSWMISPGVFASNAFSLARLSKKWINSVVRDGRAH